MIEFRFFGDGIDYGAQVGEFRGVVGGLVVDHAGGV